MNDQLSAKDWLDQGLKTLAKSGFTALKAEPLAKAMGVSRGSFYWHFADIAAYHAAILKHWHEVAAEQIIANVEAASKDENPLAVLLRRVFGEQADAGERGPDLGERRSRGPRRRAGHRPAPAQLRRKPVDADRTVGGSWPAPAPKFSIGRFSALRYRISHCRKRANRPCSTNCCGSPRHDTLRSDMLRDRGPPETSK